MDILYLVDRLENLIAGSRRMPLVNQIILKEGDILNIVDQMRTTIPDEIKQARRVIQEKGAHSRPGAVRSLDPACPRPRRDGTRYEPRGSPASRRTTLTGTGTTG